MMRGRFFIVLSVAAGLLFCLTAFGAWALWTHHHAAVVWTMLAEAALYAAAAWFTIRHEGALDRSALRRALVLILVVAGAMRLVLIVPPPVSSDIYRYVWDGRVQAAGINPYRYLPADPALAALHDTAIFPNINRAKTALTIYPPVAQMIFLAVTRISESVTAMKAAMVAFELATMAAIVALLRRRRLPQTRILLYAWHPLPLFEFAGSGHIDAAAIAFMMLACLAADRRHPALAGVLLAAGTLVKYFPVIIAPALYRRWDWRMPIAAIATAVLLYLPYLGVGRQVLGYLPGYAQEENLTTGSGFFVLGALDRFMPLPHAATFAYLAIGLAILAALALAAVFRRNAAIVAIPLAMITVCVFTLFLSPHLAWYFTWIVPFLCFRPSAALIYVTGASPLLYGLVLDADEVTRSALLYVPFAVILLVEILARLKRPIPESNHELGFEHRHAD